MEVSLDKRNRDQRAIVSSEFSIGRIAAKSHRDEAFETGFKKSSFFLNSLAWSTDRYKQRPLQRVLGKMAGDSGDFRIQVTEIPSKRRSLACSDVG